MNTVTASGTTRGNPFDPFMCFNEHGGVSSCGRLKSMMFSAQKPMLCRGLEGVEEYKVPRFMMTYQEIIDELLGGTEEARKYSFTFDQVAAKIDLLQPKREGREHWMFCMLFRRELCIVDVGCDVCSGLYATVKFPDEPNVNLSDDDKVFRNTILTI